MSADLQGELWESFFRGWKHGTSARSYDERCSLHIRGDIRRAYLRGYEYGRTDRWAATRLASEIYGHQPSVLR